MAVLEMSLHVNIVKIYPSENKYSVYLKQCSVPIPICANNTDYKRMEKSTLCFRKVSFQQVCRWVKVTFATKLTYKNLI